MQTRRSTFNVQLIRIGVAEGFEIQFCGGGHHGNVVRRVRDPPSQA